MDGTALRYTVALPLVPGLAKSVWDKWTIALLCLVVLGTVLVILYRATPPAYTSSAPAHLNSANQEMSPTDQDAQTAETAATEMSAPAETADAGDTSGETRDPFDSQSATTAGKSQRTNRGLAPADEKEVSPAPVIHFEPASTLPAAVAASTAARPATPETGPGEKATSSQTAASSAKSSSAHPLPSEAYASKPATQNDKKDSGLKTFFKKAGKVLKKPFDDK